MSISGSLNNAVSGLTATARMAEVVSNNLANVLTEGYGKRELELSSKRNGGVAVSSVVRNLDPAVVSERRLADASLGSSERFANAAARLETAIGAVDDPYSIAARLTAFEQSLISSSADPASDQRLGTVILRLNDLTQSLDTASKSVQSLRQEADADIANDIAQLNNSLQQVAELNGSIARVRNTGGDPSALIDQRQLAIDRISTIVPVKEYDRPNGEIALITNRGVTLLDGNPQEFTFQPTPTIVADMEYSGGVLGGVMVDGAPMIPDTGFGRLSGGSLEAAFKLRDETLTQAQLGLDEIAADLMTRFESATADPTVGPTDTGLLTDNGARFDVSTIAGLSSRLEINAAVDPNAGGDLWRLRDGVNAVAQGPVGDSTQIRSWINALSAQHSYDPAVSQRSALGQVTVLTNEVSTQRVIAEETEAYDNARWNLLKEAELAEGVDSDQELQRLLLIEQAYAANARLIQAATSMLQQLTEL